MLGVAASSKALAAGAAVPYCKAGAGAIASQSFVNPYLGIDGLSLLERGFPAGEALQRAIESDAGYELRQLAIVDAQGRVAAHTGAKCIAWAGHLLGEGYVCLGNILAGEAVLEAMAAAFDASSLQELPERLLRALEAGQTAGGDRRGRQSAGLHVVYREEYPLVDLRVDDHPDPVPELRRLFELFKVEEEPWLPLMPRREDPTPQWDKVLRKAQEIEAELDAGKRLSKEK
ncbi:MAG: DUF1028 domain-containing protein [Chloroflexi bacterium]|nr:DUF1028 domain-containing protein [Chloroflexota bacterium]